MKPVGGWAKHNRLLCVSLSFDQEHISLKEQLDLIGVSRDRAILHTHINVQSQYESILLFANEDTEPHVLQLLKTVISVSEQFVLIASGETSDLIIGLPINADAKQVKLVQGIVLTVDCILRDAHNESFSAKVVGKRTRTPEPFDVLMLNAAWMDERGIAQEEHATVLDMTTGTVMEVRLRHDYAKNPAHVGEARVSAHACMRLGINKLSSLVIVPHKELAFDHVMIQQLESIAERKVLLGDEDLKQISPHYAFYQVSCPATGNSLVIPTSSFGRGPEREPGAGVSHSIRLSRHQRALLGLHTPHVVSPWFLDRLDSLSANPNAKSVLSEHYSNGTLVESLDYDSSQDVWRAFKSEGFDAVRISPLSDTPVGAPRIHNGKVITTTSKLLTRLANSYLGQTTSIHRIGRPYDVDEDRRIVRLTEDTISLLGVEIMDGVIVSYGLRSISVRVMAMENEDKIKQMNAMSESDSLEVLIGMPALLRAELCLDGLGMTVEVSRDTRFLFRKTINQQFVPALGLFLTVLSIFPPSDEPLWIPVSIFIVLLPFVAYSVLSNERSKVKVE